jgi:hypothetical protein
LFTVLTGLLAVTISGLMLLWAWATPEDVVIGVPGRHDQLAGGERLADCLDCHVPFVGTPRTRCLGPGCHGALGTGAPPRTGPAMPVRFHAALDEEPCGTCHLEHGWSEARGAFDHAVIPQATRSRCARCHLAQRASHARTDAVSCDLCHGFDAWKGAQIVHDRVANHPCDLCHATPPTEAHASVAGACDRCHGTASWDSVSQ